MRDGGMTAEESLDFLIVALCADYERRKGVIENRSAERRVDTEFRYLNFRIFDAAAEIAGEEDAEGFIQDIGERIGYAKSELWHLSEGTYKDYKRCIKDNIAKKLHLID